MNEQEFEYKFVRLKFSPFLNSSKAADAEYQNIIQDHAQKGWRLVQIFSPGIASYGASAFYECILERRVQKS